MFDLAKFCLFKKPKKNRRLEARPKAKTSSLHILVLFDQRPKHSLHSHSFTLSSEPM